MPIFSPEEEERDDLLNSISIFFSPEDRQIDVFP